MHGINKVLLNHCFESLIPPGQRSALWVYSQNLRSNEKKIAQSSNTFPLPTTRICGLKQGASSGKIITALGMEGQDNERYTAGLPA